MIRDIGIAKARIFATIFVLLGHCCYPYRGGWGFIVRDWPMGVRITSYIYSFHMAFFMMISGLVFYKAYGPKVKDMTWVELVIRRMKRLLIPLFFTKYFIWNPVNVLIGNYESIICKEALFELGHLWYLCVLFIINIVTYGVMVAVKQYEESKKAVIDSIFLFATFILALLSDKMPNMGKSVITSLYYYPLFFVIGLMLVKNKWDEKITPVLSSIVLIGQAIIWFACGTGLIRGNTFYKIVIAILGCIGWFGISKNIKMGRSLCDKAESYSMAIYLFHLPVIYMVLGLTEIGSLFPYAVVLFLFIVALVISVILAGVLRKLRWNILLGEKTA